MKVAVVIVLGAFVGAMLWLLVAIATAAPISKFSKLRDAYVNIISVQATSDSTAFSAGSGAVIWTNESMSLVLTCAHVIEEGSKAVYVYQEDDADGLTKVNAADVEKLDVVEDLALLVVHQKLLGALHLAAMEPVRWSRVYALGNGLGVGAWPSEGFVAARNHLVDEKRFMRLTLPVIYGFSGGPVVNEEGELVCITSNMMTHVVELPGSGGAIQTPATDFSMCIPLERIQNFLTDISLK